MSVPRELKLILEVPDRKPMFTRTYNDAACARSMLDVYRRQESEIEGCQSWSASGTGELLVRPVRRGCCKFGKAAILRMFGHERHIWDLRSSGPPVAGSQT